MKKESLTKNRYSVVHCKIMLIILVKKIGQNYKFWKVFFAVCRTMLLLHYFIQLLT